MSTRKVMIGFKTDIEIRQKLEEIAAREDRSISYIVNKIISDALKEMEDPAKVGQKALEELEYINSLSFVSYTDFVRHALEDGKYEDIKRNMGERMAYYIACEKIGQKPDDEFAEGLKN